MLLAEYFDSYKAKQAGLINDAAGTPTRGEPPDSQKKKKKKKPPACAPTSTKPGTRQMRSPARGSHPKAPKGRSRHGKSTEPSVIAELHARRAFSE
ncbi:hypothetical protein [Rhodococcus opacus]|uniref:hypothetical protein n=1 Tax=Rhodococcus opacus TaxID=37919 RepID=UPI0024B95A78|nr:hypothetical protein [Rhodococcus opacus]MDJ0418560.1 hypothetical protein [Rhodococcus opacus]